MCILKTEKLSTFPFVRECDNYRLHSVFAAAQQIGELMITPDPQNSGAIVRAEKSSLVYTCSVRGADPEQDANLRWFNPKGVEVQDASGRYCDNIHSFMCCLSFLFSFHNIFSFFGSFCSF